MADDVGSTESSRKRAIRELADRQASERDRWIARNHYYYEEDERYTRFLVPPGLSVLDLGCGTGRLLAALEPSRGVGVDLSAAMVEEASRRHPDLEFHVGDAEDPKLLARLDGPFDIVLLSDTVGSLEDCQATLENLHAVCHHDTRVVVAWYSRAWAPILGVARMLGQQMPSTDQNWLSALDLAGILSLAGFEVVRLDHRQILPKRLGGMGPAVNRFVGTLPGVARLGLRSYLVARPMPTSGPSGPSEREASGPSGMSVTVVIPTRNEAGNVRPAVDRIPRFCDDMEILFVEGHSEDDTLDEIKRVIAERPDLDIKVVGQPGKGKADVVRAGFDAARGEVLMVLDGDLTTPPEDLPKFYEAVFTRKGELAMGTRLVYPMEQDAMRPLNMVGNKAFALVFSWLLNQRITDTLCGTKVLTKADYERIRKGRGYFGGLDPFGDFDLIFGAAKLNLKIVEIPVRYRARAYGSTQISRFRHGLLLLRMVAVAYRKLKAL